MANGGTIVVAYPFVFKQQDEPDAAYRTQEPEPSMPFCRAHR